MKRFLFLMALLCAFSFPVFTPVFADEEKIPVKLKSEVPYREDSGLTKAEYFLAKGKNAEAMAESIAVLKRHPRSADAYVYRGLAYDRMGDAQKAMESFKKAITLNPTHMGANKYLADLYLADGNLTFALEQMQVLRLACGTAIDCPEMEDLQSAINKAKKIKKKKVEEE